MRDRDPNRLPYLGAKAPVPSRETSYSSTDSKNLSREREAVRGLRQKLNFLLIEKGVSKLNYLEEVKEKK